MFVFANWITSRNRYRLRASRRADFAMMCFEAVNYLLKQSGHIRGQSLRKTDSQRLTERFYRK